ncbi:metallophosphoesterase [Cnuibacter sp. UC19_7]|uniref:metallophosphoesterase n=1 Tax=Cnuibacter sp. UC19_7 TaxID=3350166 RepID=UPI00366B0AE7
MRSPTRRALAALLAGATGLTLGTGALVAAPAALAADVPAVPPLLVTEIDPDNDGDDHFEFFELANTTDADIDLTASGLSLSYIYADSDDSAKDKALTVPAGSVVPAHGTAVVWLQYASGKVDSFSKTDDDFRAHFPEGAEDYPIIHATGQAGMANGGDRGIRVIDRAGASVSWSFYPAGSVGPDRGAHFALPADPAARSMRVLSAQADATPGLVDPAAFQRPGDGDPDPDPTDPPSPEPTDPAPAPGPQPDPSLVTAPLQVTELLPDSSNVGSGDGYEFIEVYNATSTPVDFGDYTIRYLYPLEDLTNSQTALWPAQPSNPVIQPGKTLVLWVKNGANDALTAADFNAKFGTSLTAGTDLVEIHSAGMANGSPRGIEVITNTGFSVNRAYYNLGGADDTVADQGIQYAVDPADTTRQRLSGLAPASPGAVTAEQVPAGLMVPAVDTAAPTIADATAATITPGSPFRFTFSVTDDTQVRTVTLRWKTNVDAGFRSVNLTSDGSDGYAFSVPAADLTGARSVDYQVTASDGRSLSSTEVVHLPVEGADSSPLRLNVADGQFVSGQARLAAATDDASDTVTLSVDGAPVQTSASLEAEPVFAFDASGVNVFFKNGVRIGDDVLHIFDDGIPEGYETVATPVPLSYVTQGQELVVSVWAGTKAAPVIDPNENNDDFTIKNLRLVLPDGRTLTPVGYDDSTTVLQMGDSTGKLDFYDARFVLPDDAFAAKAATWDTTAVADGAHTVAASSSGASASATVSVDNTAPVITTGAVDGTEYRGGFTLDASATDAGSGLASSQATLDGSRIALPYATSSVTLASGTHSFVVTAEDALGNTATRTVSFTTPDEQPGTELVSPVDGAIVTTRDVDLTATPTDPSGDVLDVDFAKGYHLDPTDSGVTSWKGATEMAAAVDRTDRAVLTGDELAAMTGADGVDSSVSSGSAFPYQMFDVTVPAEAGDDAQARLAWSGSANADAKVLMYVMNTATGSWEEVDRHVTASGAAPESFDLAATVPVADHVKDGALTVLVQHSEGFTSGDLSSRTSDVTPYHPDATPRSDYDFTLAWETDTQYYNANPDYYQHQLDIHDFVLDQRDELNLQYLFHTGDIVDDSTIEDQWIRADAAYDELDAAGLPYGVLAGNHDVGHKEDDYSHYSQWFGESRYASNPWYGGSYLDNRGHYDLFSAGGIDFMVVSMGWGPGEAEIAWMNDVIARYPERKVILNLHEFMLTTGGLGDIPQRIQDEVVATNPNVMMVMSGHYHDAFTRADAFDDDGDGTPERTVYSMLFDYQGLAEGGLGYLRLLHFDDETGTITVRTYSPSLDDFDSDDPSLDMGNQEFTMSYETLGITPAVKELATDAFSADILTTDTVESLQDVASGTTVSATWTGLADGPHGWYVRTEDPYGAVDLSAVRTFTVDAAAAPGEPGEPGGPGGPGSGDPTQPGGPEDPEDSDSGDGAGADAGAGQAGGPDSAQGSGTGRDGLASTGAAPIAVGAAAALLLALGGTGLILRRRRVQ